MASAPVDVRLDKVVKRFDETVAVDGISLEINYAQQAATGATGAKSAVASNNADIGNTHILALRRAP